MRTFILLIISTLLTSCANHFADFYVDGLKGADITKIEAIDLLDKKPEILRGTDVDTDTTYMIESGYFQIGYSAYNGAEIKESNLVQHAIQRKAAKVILYTQYSDTVAGAMPLTLPNTQTSNTNFMGSSSGGNIGYVTHQGTATTTTYGTQTNYIPYNVRRYDVLATYWVKLDKNMLDFGADVVPLPPEIKDAIGSNKGVLVMAVVEDTPAYDADILRGDVLVEIDGVPVNNMNGYFKVKKLVKGREVPVKILRKYTEIIKDVSFHKVVYKDGAVNSAEVKKVRVINPYIRAPSKSVNCSFC